MESYWAVKVRIFLFTIPVVESITCVVKTRRMDDSIRHYQLPSVSPRIYQVPKTNRDWLKEWRAKHHKMVESWMMPSW